MSGPWHDNFGGVEGFSVRSILFLLIAILCGVSVWFYADWILIPHQAKDAAEHGRPRGNLSDLYPRWLGAQELLLHHRNPYGYDVTVEIQKGYYGRALDPARLNDPKDLQAFAYPAYVVFLLAPLIWFSFHCVQGFFHWFLLLVTTGSVMLWLRIFRWRLPLIPATAAIALTIGSIPVMQGVKLQQLSVLVAALMAISVACISEGYFSVGGALLALATIKPQLAWSLAAWLILWAINDWRRRRNFVFGFGLAMALLLAGAEILLPGWLVMFLNAVGQYHQYTQNQSVIEVGLKLIVGPSSAVNLVHVVALALSALAVVLCVPVFWHLRKEDANNAGFGYATALALALAVLVVPMYAPYNQILLLPAILILARECKVFARPAGKSLYSTGVALLAWPWAASLSLTVIYLFVSPERALARWTVPLFSTFGLPIVAFALTLLLWRAITLQSRAGRT